MNESINSEVSTNEAEMTPEEAIKVIKNTIIRFGRGNGKTLYVKALNVGIKALEKMTAKTPDYEGDGYWNGQLVYDTWICPCCGKHYEVDYDDYKHCPECGQKILLDSEV